MAGETNQTNDVPNRAPPERGRSWKSRILFRMLFLPLVAVAGLYFMSMSANPPSTLGVRNGTLAECPESPNCVATQSGNDSQRMEPVSYEGSSEAIIEKIKSTVETKFARTKLISETEHYLHFEFTSLIFRFVDDVEFLIDDTSKQIHFRSASRVGYSDLGANRKRMQTIVDELNP